jgi:hypothetical protein
MQLSHIFGKRRCMHMLQRAVRHPATLTAIAAAIVLATASVAAPLIAPHVGPIGMQVEKVTVTRQLEPAALAGSSRNASSTAPSLVAPQIAETADLKLYVSDVDGALTKIAMLIHRESGVIFSSDLSRETGNLELRVPESNFGATMAALAHIGTVRESSSSAEDLSADIIDSSARLRNLRRTESDMLRIMDRSGTVGQILNVENQLSDVRGQIEQLEADLKSMHQHVAYSTITTELDAEPATVPVHPSVGAQLANQWQDAVAHLGAFTLGVVALIMWLVVFAPYVLVPSLIVWLLARRRKHAVRG